MAKAYILPTDPDVLTSFATSEGTLELDTEFFGEPVFHPRGEPSFSAYTGLSPSLEMEVLAEIQFWPGSSGGGRFAGGVGVLVSDAAATGISAESTIVNSTTGNNERLIEWSNGSRSIVADIGDSPVNIENWHFLKVKVGASGIVTLFRWEGQVDEPPATPMASYQVPAGFLIARYAGIVSRNPQRRVGYRFLSIGTDGDPAPTSPVAAGPTTPTGLITSAITATGFRAGWTP